MEISKHEKNSSVTIVNKTLYINKNILPLLSNTV